MIPKVVVRGTGKNTLSLIEEVEEIIEQRQDQDLPPFYNVWIVMDKDVLTVSLTVPFMR